MIIEERARAVEMLVSGFFQRQIVLNIVFYIKQSEKNIFKLNFSLLLVSISNLGDKAKLITTTKPVQYISKVNVCLMLSPIS